MMRKLICLKGVLRATPEAVGLHKIASTTETSD